MRQIRSALETRALQEQPRETDDDNNDHNRVDRNPDLPANPSPFPPLWLRLRRSVRVPVHPHILPLPLAAYICAHLRHLWSNLPPFRIPNFPLPLPHQRLTESKIFVMDLLTLHGHMCMIWTVRPRYRWIAGHCLTVKRSVLPRAHAGCPFRS
jgi:hypothetical protein